MSSTNGFAPLSVQFTDHSENAASLSWDFENDGTLDSTDKNPVYVYNSPGTYTVNLTATNENWSASKTAIVTVTQASGDNSGSSGTEDGGTGDSETENDGGSSSSDSSHSSGSSGGGAGGSPEPQSNVEIKELSQTFVTGGKPVKFDFPRKATSVVYLSFDSKKTAGKTTTIVEMLKGKSILVTELPSDEIYKYINIWVGNSGFATPSNIENSVISFKVEKSWIQDKKIDRSSITLNRYDDGKWVQLPVNLTGEDKGFIYLTAKTPGFSSFAIAGKTEKKDNIVDNSQPASQPVSQPGLETGNLSKNGDGLSLNSEVKKAFEHKTSTKSPGFETGYGIISLIALFLHRRNKKRN